MQNGTTAAATPAPEALKTPETKPEEPDFKIEIAVCENIDRSISGKGDPPIYHVEFRFIPSPGAHSICFRGDRFKDRAKAEAQKTYVESVFKKSALVKPKPVKERKTVKTRKRSRRS